MIHPWLAILIAIFLFVIGFMFVLPAQGQYNGIKISRVWSTLFFVIFLLGGLFFVIVAIVQHFSS